MLGKTRTMADKKKKTARKTLRKDEAPYARKLDDAPKGGGDDKGGGQPAPDNATLEVKDGDKTAAAPGPNGDKTAAAPGPNGDSNATSAGGGDTKNATPAASDGTVSEPATAPAAAPAAATPVQASAPEPAAAPVASADDAPVYAELPRVTDIDRTVSPDAPALAPGLAPAGDSRSLRRNGASGEEFLLIYREHTFLVTRAGPVGKHGAWTIVEYPSQGSAANAYAHKCSEYTGAGYYDLD
ncbi:MAG TPA: hypothetical protein VML75_25045 [Kofleriaceae bacterium]|nr:hypothetical protein [Kofleriaceae bacterium]